MFILGYSPHRQSFRWVFVSAPTPRQRMKRELHTRRTRLNTTTWLCRMSKKLDNVRPNFYPVTTGCLLLDFPGISAIDV